MDFNKLIGFQFHTMSKTDKYCAREDIDELENLSDRLASDLRKNIRALGSHPIYSPAWCDMAETC